MSKITIEQVKDLRERTGAPMMACKKALETTKGDIPLAIEHMRKAGQASASKKSGRIASEGVIAVLISQDAKKAIMIEVNCETDFVARDTHFKDFVAQLLQVAMASGPADLDALNALSWPGDSETVASARIALVAKVGENIQIRRFVVMQTEDHLLSYVHNDRIGVLVDYQGEDSTLGRSVAMHVVANNPQVVRPKHVPQAIIDKEREIYEAQAASSGKPAEIVTKMVEGRIQKFVKEISLLEQPFVKDPAFTVGEVLKQAGANVHHFIRFEVGEGIEKESTNYAQEVMAQVEGAR